VETRIGFRDAQFRTDGFYLNGKKIKLRGLNRHQSYPYTGYAMPASVQRYDADILKNELGCNIVRTSHYPQSPHFIDRCDELGLLVFTEIPGWQHIGGEAWKDQAVKNVEDMVRQYRNHPSIILWGVRINESRDDDALYTRTNTLAHELDPSRQTGGVRCIMKSNLLEDVYTYNDFIHDGNAAGCKKKQAVTSDLNKPYMVTEYNGHMFPTKAFDTEEHRLEHAVRHAVVLNAIAAEEDIAGSTGWCMFDYNTHKDFGSGDRICYHGVLDMFRNHKLAADVYASQGLREPVLSVSTSMNIGEHPAAFRGRVLAFTNADSVRMYRNGTLIREFKPEDSAFPHLPHPPLEIDDFIGDEIREKEHFAPRQAEYITELINYASRYGYSHLPVELKRKMIWLKLRYGMKFSDAEVLYNKYTNNWGDAAAEYRFDAVKDGAVVASVTKAAVQSLRLHAEVSNSILNDGETYDAALVRITARDQNGNLLPFYQEAVTLETEGPIRLIGPEQAMLRGGMGGTFVRTVGVSGDAVLTLSAPGAEPVKLAFSVRGGI
jgi:beta-galactosidase